MSELDEEFEIDQIVKLTKSQKERYGSNKSDCHKVNGEYPQKWARRVLRNYVGKSYNDAFSYFCSIVPIYQQRFFKSEFDLSQGYWIGDNKYTLDEEGLIQIVPRKTNSGPVTFRSYDFREGYKNKRDGSITLIPTRWGDWNSLRYVNAYPERYDKVVVAGYTKEFESEKDREYVRLMKEKTKLQKLNKKIQKKEKKLVDYSFLTIKEVHKKLDAEADRIKNSKTRL